MTPWAPIAITLMATLGAALLVWRFTHNAALATSTELLFLALASFALGSIAVRDRAVASRKPMVSPEKFPDPSTDIARAAGAEGVAVLAGGCFWCVEAVYKQLDGVSAVTSGYAGGSADSADYETVSSGRTEHAEAVKVRFDPRKISYGQILKVFFSIAHDPTTRDRQGPDVGRQYRSEIFYADDEQRGVAEAYIKQLDAAKVFDRPIVTDVRPLEKFFEAEAYHQDYAERNPLSPYILFNARPKVQKVRTYYKERLKQPSDA